RQGPRPGADLRPDQGICRDQRRLQVSLVIARSQRVRPSWAGPMTGSATKQSIFHRVEAWIALLLSQLRGGSYFANSFDRAVAAAIARIISGCRPSFPISTSSAAAVVPPGEVTFCLSV